MSHAPDTGSPDGIAIVGMSCRFPGAATVEEFWRVLREGRETISFFTDAELRAAGVSPALMADPNYVRARPALRDLECFDADFFNVQPREAALMDPQQRLFLECGWAALEAAGYDPARVPAATGVFAGSNASEYLLLHLYAGGAAESVSAFQALVANDKDYLATQLAYRLDLRGPALSVQTACSSSLVAVALACQSLLAYQTDLALAGGVSVKLPNDAGYVHQEGGLFSPDGHCRAFDARAAGTIFGSGVGVVVLKRLADALADGDYVHAVVKGAAVNNDGAAKVGFAAPGLDGQAEVVSLAQALADVDPESVTYVEAHGSGTPLGDAIEIAALTRAFRARTERAAFCALGSVKTNVGHLDSAAGVAGLIKTVLALSHRSLPATLHFEAPNAESDLARSPFYVNRALAPWPAGPTPRRAGVSSFGIGGTNAHLVLEEAPPPEPPAAAWPWQVVVLSARHDAALERATDDLVGHLRAHPELELADVAFTLAAGRHPFAHRRALVASDRADAIDALAARDPARLLAAVAPGEERPLAFMLPGLGDHYAGMGRELYEEEPTFRAHVDRCAALLEPELGLDLRPLLCAAPPRRGGARTGGPDLRAMLGRGGAARDRRPDPLGDTVVAQPAVFVLEYALARLWMEWGMRPRALIGHSLGEYVAACLAGVFSLEDALALVAARARLIQELPPGAMLAVSQSEADVRPALDGALSLAAVNAPTTSVVGGPPEAVAALEARLSARGVVHRRLPTRHAFHTAMMEPIAARFAEVVRGVTRRPPTVPYVSNVTGGWITAAEATDPDYWARHLCSTVRFAEGVALLAGELEPVLLEVGPGQSLGSFAMQAAGAACVVVPSVRPVYDDQSDVRFLLASLAKLWLAGVGVDWTRFASRERRRRVPLPTYPFDRQRHWVDAPAAAAGSPPPPPTAKRPDVADWFYAPVWKQLPPATARPPSADPARDWLLFLDASGIGRALADRLVARGERVVTVEAGDAFRQTGPTAFVVDPAARADYDRLLEALRPGHAIGRIVHLWSVGPAAAVPLTDAALARAQELGFLSLLFLAQGLAAAGVFEPLALDVVTTHVHDVGGDDVLQPEKATLLGACRVIPQEYPNVACRNVDVVLGDTEPTADGLVQALDAPSSHTVTALRGSRAWVQVFEPVRLPAVAPERVLRERGVYLVTGGLGAVPLVLAEHLARTVRARLVLVGRSALPPRAEWDAWTRAHGADDPTSRRLAAVRRLEDAGAEVLLCTADVTDEAEMRATVAHARARFGTIHGVVHAAGVTAQVPIQELDRTACEQQLAPKVRGLLALDRALGDATPDFCLLFSSLSSVLGGLGYAAYAASNLFLDAFAQQAARAGERRWISVDWDFWRVDPAATAAGPIGAAFAELFMTPAEGLDAMARVLALPAAPLLVNSTGDLQTRLDRWVERASPARPAGPAPALHPRPHLRNGYVAPRNDIERRVADVWQELLGIEEVGVHDNFLELGGHSLLAMQVMSRVREAFQVDLSLRGFLGAPTVAALAQALGHARGPSADARITPVARGARDEEELLARMDTLSDDQVNVLLRDALVREETGSDRGT